MIVVVGGGYMLWRRRSKGKMLMGPTTRPSHEGAKGAREVHIGGPYGPSGSKAYARMERPGTALVATREVDNFAAI